MGTRVALRGVMSRPRPVFPGRTYLVTRRCTQRQFLLQPSPRLVELFLYCLAVAAKRYGVVIHACCCMSNHWHAVCTDERGELPNFVQWLNATVARAVNAHLDRRENLFAGADTYSRVELATREDVLEKIVYVITNPVTAGLVSSWAKWPGAITGPRAHEAAGKAVERPKHFFRENGPLPKDATLRVSKPRCWSGVKDAEFGDLLRDRVNEREAEKRADMKRQGREFVGADEVKRTPRAQTPASPREPLGEINPRVAALDKWVRIERLQANERFLSEYRDAWEEYVLGARDAVFPAGTWLLRVRHGVSCQAPP